MSVRACERFCGYLFTGIRCRRYNFWRLRDELVGNCYSDGTLERRARRAVHLELLKDYLRFLAGDLSHSRSVSRSVRPLYFRITFRFDLFV